ncbi:hypothetical protein GCM10023153_31130 [Ornithinibacter aureus]|uniref:Uncharacterized protein n=1 Tax=Ornithinibacter aureus TaxID=622664 RepID=A0ABP8K8R9_9MICO|nr:hypothetical protein C8E84_1452 [Ornithinibacter aureus]
MTGPSLLDAPDGPGEHFHGLRHVTFAVREDNGIPTAWPRRVTSAGGRQPLMALLPSDMTADISPNRLPSGSNR